MMEKIQSRPNEKERTGVCMNMRHVVNTATLMHAGVLDIISCDVMHVRVRVHDRCPLTIQMHRDKHME